MGKMGKKKGKGKGQDERRVADEEAPPLLEGAKDEGGDTTSDTPQAKPGGGRKGKKAKKKFDDDWDDEVAEDLEELGLDAGKKDEAPEDQPEKEPSASASAGGKKSKKKKRKKDDWEDDLEEDIEALAHEIEGGGMELEPNQPQEKPKPVTETPIPQTDEETKPEASGGTEDGPNREEGEAEEEEEEASTGTVMTAAQKKAAKKEREKKKKKEAAMKAKQQQQKQAETEKEKGGTEIDSVAAVTDAAVSEVKGQGLAAEESSEVKSEPVEGATGGDGDEGEGEGEGEGKEEGDDKKKKKKKKKKPEEEKKSKVKKPGKATLAKMKEQMEALRLEQKKREEEELARIRAEEEAERKRLEELRLEEERKEKKRAKERERKERRKAEGKPITRAEREKHARAQAQLEALKAQGIAVPLRTAEHQEGAEKKKVLYVTRQKQKKPKPQTAASESDQASETTSTVSSEQQDEAASMISETSSGVAEPEPQSDSDEAVKENWDDEVKDNWDDESEGEPDTPVQSKRVKEVDVPVKLVQQETLESGSEEEEEDEEESSSSESEEEESSGEEELSAYEKAALRIENRRKRNKEERSLDLLRSPVVCVLGHVDTGKTKILDKIRRTHVQDDEAGGITQQIGATFVPEDAIREQTKMLKEFSKMEMKIPGLLIIDTPGHEAFSNLRSRGSSMCDIAILVVDIMHGLEPQTLESLAILQKGKTPFVVALNKVDRLFDWRRNPNSGIRENLKKQKVNTRDEFDERLKQITTEFAEQGLNVSLFWEKVDFQEYLPMVPTSAITGDGMGDLIALVVSNSQKTLSGQLMLSQELEALVLEVKVTPGHGTTIDVILRDGILREGETMILTGTEGPFVTPIRTLLMPQPMRELRVKNPYVHHKAIIASQGVKVCAKDLEKTLAGTPIFVAKKSDEIPVLKDEAAATMKRALSAIQLQERGVFVQASTLGSLEALLGFLKKSKIPYAGVNIGPIYKKDIMKASVMLERDTQWAVILAFDVTVDRDAQQLADHLGVKIFMADIIYHLFDSFLKHRKELHEQKRKEFEHIAIFPSKLRILPNCIFNSRDPLVVGVIVEAGIIKPGTPITIPGKNFLDIGVVSSLEVNHKPVESARKGTEVCIKVESQGDAPRLYGRHFDHTDMLVSKINRESIDAVKNYFREDLQKSDWQLMIELKKLFQII